MCSCKDETKCNAYKKKVLERLNRLENNNRRFKRENDSWFQDSRIEHTWILTTTARVISELKDTTCCWHVV